MPTPSHASWGRGCSPFLLHMGTLQTSSPGKQLLLHSHSIPTCFCDAQGMVGVKPNSPSGGPVP